MRVFVDTNVVISAMLFPNGKVAKVFSHLLEKHTLIISSYTKDECKEVFEKKFPEKIEQLDIFFNSINFEEFTSAGIPFIKPFNNSGLVKYLYIILLSISFIVFGNVIGLILGFNKCISIAFISMVRFGDIYSLNATNP